MKLQLGPRWSCLPLASSFPAALGPTGDINGPQSLIPKGLTFVLRSWEFLFSLTSRGPQKWYLRISKYLRNGGSDSKRTCLKCRGLGFDPWVRKIWRREWKPTLVFLPEKAHGQRNPEGYIRWGRKEFDTTEWLNWVKDWMKFVLKFFLYHIMLSFSNSILKNKNDFQFLPHLKSYR